MQINIKEKFPLSTVIFSSLINIMIYALGIYLVASFSRLLTLPYILFLIWMEVRVMRLGCRDCYYYNKLCAFGKGRLCAKIMKQGESWRFNSRKLTWASLIPDMFVSLFPLAFGVYILIRGFYVPVLIAMILLIIFAFPVTGYIRGSLACKYCKQRELGCPAEKLFSGKK